MKRDAAVTSASVRAAHSRAARVTTTPCFYYVPKMTWEQVGQDYNEAVRRRVAKEHEFLQEKREQSTQLDTTPKAPSSLEELRTAFLAMKGKERKRDRTPLDEYTVRAYEQLARFGFPFITRVSATDHMLISQRAPNVEPRFLV
jgi:hypothetical protein